MGSLIVEKPRKKRKPPKKPKVIRQVEVEPEFIEPEFVQPEPVIGWTWFEREPADGIEDAGERAARVLRSAEGATNQFLDPSWVENEAPSVPADVLDRDGSWWDGQRKSAS